MLNDCLFRSESEAWSTVLAVGALGRYGGDRPVEFMELEAKSWLTHQT